jgi:hypothetical protein
MHSHGASHLDIRLSKEDQERMLKEGKAEPHHFAPQAGWVTFRIRSVGDVEAAKELIRLAYGNAGKDDGGSHVKASPEKRPSSLGFSQPHQEMSTVSALFDRNQSLFK